MVLSPETLKRQLLMTMLKLRSEMLTLSAFVRRPRYQPWLVSLLSH